MRAAQARPPRFPRTDLCTLVNDSTRTWIAAGDVVRDHIGQTHTVCGITASPDLDETLVLMSDGWRFPGRLLTIVERPCAGVPENYELI